MTIHLSILIFWPLLLAVLGGLAPRGVAPLFAVVGAFVPLGYAVIMLADFDTGAAGLQYVTDDAWIDELGIRYSLGIDGLNLWLVALTTLLFAASALWVALRPPVRAKLFAVHFGIAETAVLGAFVAQDLALFVLFFDLMLVPFYFLLGQWGGPERVAAAVKMVVYTLVGSLLMLAAAVATAVLASPGELTFALSDLRENLLGENSQKLLFAAFALAFLIKMPSFPFHGWMPDAYRNMPLPVLAVFSGVVSKVAAYGFLRIALPLFPEAVADWQLILLIIALLSIVYGSVLAFTQTNIRLILGYSSIAQLGFITLGIFALDPEGRGAQGALLQAINHGLVVAPLFLIAALLAARAAGSEDLRDMGGIATRAPVLATLFMIVTLATLAMPGSANFVGEFFILLGVFESELAVAIIASTGVILASVYALRLYIRSMHNREGPAVTSFDMGLRDAIVLVPLVLAILAFAVYPQLALEAGEGAVQAVTEAVAR
ncbi:MAG TPA: NADH-quinone oxidoreductase subunit M [Solirubrobacteraceae bacterium]|nr:NADH-quinone oxidoreductase subunit M [Solirubrobacteraceae bacterium]